MSIKYKIIPRKNPRDLEGPVKFYAIPVHGKTYNLKELAKELAARSTTASEGDTYSVLIGMRDLMKEHIERSERVLIDSIGTFDASLSSEGSEEEDKFHQGLIKGGKLRFQADAEMKDFVKSLRFEKYVPKA